VVAPPPVALSPSVTRCTLFSALKAQRGRATQKQPAGFLEPDGSKCEKWAALGPSPAGGEPVPSAAEGRGRAKRARVGASSSPLPPLPLRRASGFAPFSPIYLARRFEAKLRWYRSQQYAPQ